MESSINGFQKRNEKEMKRKNHTFHPEKFWEERTQKQKKKGERDYKKSFHNLKAKQYEIEDDEKYKRTIGKAIDADTHKEQLTETDDCTKAFDGTAKKKLVESGMPSIYECTRQLKEKVPIKCIGNKLFYYDGRCYQPLDKQKIVSLFRQYVRDDLYNCRSMKLFHELYDYLLADSDIQCECDIRRLSNLAVLANGIYNVKSGKLQDFDSSVIALSYVNANYVENAECPKFDKFLRDVTGNDSVLIERLWMFLGYIFTQSLDAKAFFVMGHASNSGKSVLGKFIENLYDKQYVSSIALSDFNGDFSMGTLVGAAVNISLDLPNSRLNATAVSKLKMLTGGDMITINEKYLPQFQYQNRAKFIFASNHPLKLTEDDEAFWERLVYLPFDFSIDKENQKVNLLDKLLREKDAVVSKALRYAKKLMESHYQFPTTDEIERRICEWRGINVDTIEAFIKKCCDIDVLYKGEIIEDLYSRYIRFCDDEKEKPKARNDFKKYLEAQVGLKHFKMRRGKADNPQSAFQGIKIIEEGDA